MTYHLVIKTERRVSTPERPRELAIAMNNDLRVDTGRRDTDGNPVYSVTVRPPQLHTQAGVVNDWSNIVYASTWDGRSPWIEVLQRTVADLVMAYMGWPMVDEAAWLAANPTSTLLESPT